MLRKLWIEIVMLVSKINRQSAQRAKKRLFWCSRCDHQKNGQHGKCWNCGNRENKKSIKGLQSIKKMTGSFSFL